MPSPPRPADTNATNAPTPSSPASSNPTQEPNNPPHTVPMPFPMPSPLHIPGELPATPRTLNQPTQEEPSPPPIPHRMNAQPEQPTLSCLRIWQQNLNTSHTAQPTLLNGPTSDEWDVLALQEPALNTIGNTRASTHWRVSLPGLQIHA